MNKNSNRNVAMCIGGPLDGKFVDYCGECFQAPQHMGPIPRYDKPGTAACEASYTTLSVYRHGTAATKDGSLRYFYECEDNEGCVIDMLIAGYRR